MLNWQFSQFALLTQTASILGCYLLRFIGKDKFWMVLECQLIAFVINYIAQFGNEMLITSFYASSLITVVILLSAIGPITVFIIFKNQLYFDLK